MFTGIIESAATVVSLKQEGGNITFILRSPIARELKIDQSLSHNGVCLTVVEIQDDEYGVTAIRETLRKSNLGMLKTGDRVNLERCMPATGRFDGHIVQGHVDQLGTCTSVTDEGGSWQFDFEYDPSRGNITVEKGSIAVNGVSLTCFNSSDGKFSVAIIPYTWKHTNFETLKPGQQVNLEFDILGKYIRRLTQAG